MKIRVNPRHAGRFLAGIARLVGCTLRFQIDDRSRLTDPGFHQPVIWTFWHNRMFVVPLLSERFCPHRTGAILTSASKDGDVIAAVMENFRLKTVRGSSSRRGTTALLALAGTLEQGEDVAVTPDGPRGPLYKLGPGVVFLSRQTGAAIQPIHVEYSRALRLKSWDRFMIPMPFARVRIILGPLVVVPPDADLEAERLRIEKILQPPPSDP